MRTKRLLAISALVFSISCVMTACSFGGEEPEDQVIVEFTPTPAPTKAPDLTPTIAPNAQTTIYTSADKKISMKLPDATWSNKTDEEDMLSFESPEAGKILILHGEGAEDMSVAVLPSTLDMAVSLEQAADLVQGTDFEILNYSSENVSGVNVYSYVVKMLNPEKSDGYSYVVNKVFANEEEFYSISGSVKGEENLQSVQKSINTFTIKGNSTLKAAAQGQQQTEQQEGQQTDNGTSTNPATSGSTDTTTGQQTDSYLIENIPVGSTRDRFTEEALADTNQTRTLYSNTDGSSFVVFPDENGNWVDFEGNTYEFINDEDAYDQNGVDYYYHGEAADVYYMPSYSK